MDRKEQRMHLRVAAADKALVAHAARAVVMSMSNFALQAPLRAAEDTVSR